MCEVTKVYDEITAAIELCYSSPSQTMSKNNALTTLQLMYTLYTGAEKLKVTVRDVDERTGKAAVVQYQEMNANWLSTGGEFIPKQEDGSHLEPTTFIKYTQQAMQFFVDKWAVSAPNTRALMIEQLLAHHALTYPRLVSYIQKWMPPEQSDLSLVIIAWLYSDMTDAFTGAENSVNHRLPIAEQITKFYQIKRDNKRTYCVFWGTLLAKVDKAFSLKFNKNALLSKIQDSRTQLHQSFMGLISVQEIDIFIDHCFEDVYNWIILGPDDED